MGELATLLTGGGILSVVGLAFFYLAAGSRVDRKALADERDETERVQAQLDNERVLRRAAEDREAALARQVARLSEKVDHLSAEVAKLRAQLGTPP